jgi:DNA polymerase III alpha subunit
MAAVISNQGGYYSTFAYVSEAKRLGLVIMHPDVCESDIRWKGAGEKIRVGLQTVAGLSTDFIERIITARATAQFADAGNFFSRTLPADNEARALIHAGGLDSLQPPANRTVLLWQWASFQRMTHDKKNGSLFAIKLPPPPILPPPDKKSELRREYLALGFLCDYHPLQLIARTKKNLEKIADLQMRVGQRVKVAGWLLTGKLVSTRTGEVMEFLTFEDETGQLETTFFPTVYRAYAHFLRSGRGYILTGLVEQDYGALTLTVEQVHLITGK